MIAANQNMDVAGKRLLVHADLNVPMADGGVADATRITLFAAGMKGLLAKGASLVILSHFGRPKGGLDAASSLRHLRDGLSRAFGCLVGFAKLEEALAAAMALQPGQVLQIEKIRFEAGEERNDPALAACLAQLGDVYVNDAFSCAHRAHASTEAIARALPSPTGPLMMEELGALEEALEAPKSPLVAIVGGRMANTFRFADGAPMGKSLHEADNVATVAEIRALVKQHGCTIHIAQDAVVARAFAAQAPNEVLVSHACPENAMILDAGLAVVERFKPVLWGAKTILWNGPLDAFKMPPFDRATVALAQVAADLTRAGICTPVAGGGHTVAALNAAMVAEQFTYVSTAGGAFLEWLEGQTLPGVAALVRADQAA